METKLTGRAIGIASALVGYEDAKERLSSWGVPLQESRRGWMAPGRWMWVLPLLVLFLFGGFYLATGSWITIATGVPLLAGLSWSLWFILKSLQVSANTKRLSLITVLPLLAITAKLVLSIIHWR